MNNPPARAGRKSAREAALDILTQVERGQAYSNLLLNQTLQKSGFSRADAALVTEIVYGTIQRRNTIDYFLRGFVSHGLDKLEPWVRNLLRLSMYQLCYLSRIPAHAAVNEAVEIAKHRGHRGISGLVNAVLRNVLRSRERLTIPDHLPEDERMSLALSHPLWLVRRWLKDFGPETTEQICRANNERPHVSIRVNRLRKTRAQLAEEMNGRQFSVRPSVLHQDGLVVEHGGNPAFTEWYKNGDFSIQDESSMLVAGAVAPEPGMNVLDCCAAPGGKTAHLAELMNDTGTVWANDVHEHKVRLIAEQAERMRLKSVRWMAGDARCLAKKFPEQSFDRILLDAPCSGLGVIRRKPDIKWSKSEEEIRELPKLQLELLEAVAPLLKPGGIMVYSTCTIAREENEGVIETFLKRREDLLLDPFPAEFLPGALLEKITVRPGMALVLPHQFHSDGFFIARLKKKC